MNNSIDIIIELAQLFKKFELEKDQEEPELKDFVLWLNSVVFNQDQLYATNHKTNDIDMELTFLLIMQSKYFKMYCKEVLTDIDINSPDEYSFLYHLGLVESYRKMELISIHLLEAPSGIEIIKRLLKKGYIEDFDDKDDKRAKRVRITKKGKEVMKLADPLMKKIYPKMTAELSLNEKIHMISYLLRFNHSHSNN